MAYKAVENNDSVNDMDGGVDRQHEHYGDYLSLALGSPMYQKASPRAYSISA